MLRMHLLALWATLLCSAGQAHIMQYFTYMQASREVTITSDTVQISYDCTFLPDTLTTPPETLDIDRNGSADNHERGSFFQRAAEYLGMDIICFHQRQLVPLRTASVEVRPDYVSFKAVLEGKLYPGITSGDEPMNIVDPAFLIMIPGTQPIPETRVHGRGIRFLTNAGVGDELTTASTPTLNLFLKRAGAASK